jgi:hypothetical protein
LGLVSGIIFVEISSGRHLRLSHSWFGIVTLLLVLATPLLGQAFLKVKSNKKRYRFLHSWSGRITLSLMGLTAYLGIKLLGLL